MDFVSAFYEMAFERARGDAFERGTGDPKFDFYPWNKDFSVFSYFMSAGILVTGAIGG